ncbi:MAG: caspase family protein [Gemmataceae bacterium]
MLRFSLVLTLASAVSLAGEPEKAAGGRYALIVAVKQYDVTELKPLKYTENDAAALAETLKAAGYKRIVVMSQTRGAVEARYLPTAANVRRELKGLLDDRGEDDGVVVAFAGHGVQFAGDDETFFCPMDAKLGDRSSLVSLGDVYAELKECEASFKLLLADVCRRDPRPTFDRSPKEPVKLQSVSRPQTRKPPQGVAAYFSCSPGEQAYESPKLERGVFFHYVVEAMRGKAAKDGAVTLFGLTEYVSRRVADRVRDEFGPDVRQRPELIGQTSGAPVLTTGHIEPKNVESKKSEADDEPNRKPRRLMDRLRRILGKDKGN